VADLVRYGEALLNACGRIVTGFGFWAFALLTTVAALVAGWLGYAVPAEITLLVPVAVVLLGPVPFSAWRHAERARIHATEAAEDVANRVGTVAWIQLMDLQVIETEMWRTIRMPKAESDARRAELEKDLAAWAERTGDELGLIDPRRRDSFRFAWMCSQAPRPLEDRIANMVTLLAHLGG
jgi:hypothetical protein